MTSQRTKAPAWRITSTASSSLVIGIASILLLGFMGGFGALLGFPAILVGLMALPTARPARPNGLLGNFVAALGVVLGVFSAGWWMIYQFTGTAL